MAYFVGKKLNPVLFIAVCAAAALFNYLLLRMLSHTLPGQHGPDQAFAVLEKETSASILSQPRNSLRRKAFRAPSQASVAVCLCGGLRMLELTAYGLQKYVFSAYPNSDVFVFAPLDETSQKLLIFADALKRSTRSTWQFRSLSFHIDAPLDDEVPAATYLDPIFSGIGVLLQTYELMEGCLDLVREVERDRGFNYSWVVRARPDGFWVAPAPPLKSFDSKKFTTPAGYEWSGLNDRHAMVPRALADQGLGRLKLLSQAVMGVNLSAAPFKRLGGHVNGENSLRLQLLDRNISVGYQDFAFCILTKHEWPGLWPIRENFPPIFSISSTAQLNGAYCRPCVADLGGNESATLLSSLEQGFNRPFHVLHQREGWDLCDPSGPWVSNWEEVFDSLVEEGARRTRQKYARMRETNECIEELEKVVSSFEYYRGPPARLLCKIRTWGPLFGQLKAGRSVPWQEILETSTRVQGRNPSTLFLPTFPILQDLEPRLQKIKFRSQACHLFMRIGSSRPYMHVKATLVRQLQDEGWEILKCSGRLREQYCLFSQRDSCQD